jgi:hypothetical protein
MSNQAKIKDGRRTPPKTVRLTEQNKINLQKYQNDHGFNRTDAINGILEKFFLHGFEEEIIEIQTCEFHSANVSHPEFTRCRQYGYWQDIKTKQCIACRPYTILQIPITTIPRLEVKLKDYKIQFNDWHAQTEKLKIEALQLDKTTERGYQNTIKEMGKDWKLTQETLRETTEERDWLRIAKSPIEFDEKLHSDPLSHTQREIQKPSVETYMAEEVTEKVTKKFVPHQPQESKTPSQLALCPKTKEMVSFEGVCKKTCMTFMECRNYNEIVMLNKVIVKR